MALLLLNDGIIEKGLGNILDKLSPLGVQLRHLHHVTHWLFPQLTNGQEILTPSTKQELMRVHNHLFHFLKEDGGYLWSDLWNVHPGSSDLSALLKTYNIYHAHTAPETLYVLFGEAIFTFKMADGQELQLLLQPQDFISIPAGVEHRFSLTGQFFFQAVRYFKSVEGSIPQYSKSTKINY